MPEHDPQPKKLRRCSARRRQIPVSVESRLRWPRRALALWCPRWPRSPVRRYAPRPRDFSDVPQFGESTSAATSGLGHWHRNDDSRFAMALIPGARLAPAVDIEGGVVYTEAVRLFHPGEERRHLRLRKILDGATVSAHQVVVVSGAFAQQVAGLVACERHVLDDPGPLERLERPKDGGSTDATICLTDGVAEFLGGERSPCALKHAGDEIALGRDALARCEDPVSECIA